MVTGEVRLLQLQSIDVRDDIEDFWLRNRDLVFQNAKIQSEAQVDQESTKNVIAAAHQNKHDEIQIGTCCIYLLCTDDNVAARWFSCLTMAARDSLAGVIQKLCELTHSKWTKFTDQTKKGLLRLVKEMAKMSYGAHSLINVLLRHIVGGDLTNQNVWLMETLLDVLNENRVWLERNQETLQSATFRYLRLIQDHYGSPNHERLCQKEIGFTMGTLRLKFAEVVPIGRDLVRLLIAVSHVREFHEFWSELIHRPGQLMPNFTGIKELLKTRTSKKFLMLNISPEMETKIQFILSKVKFGQHDPYQKWFTRSYLSSLSSQSLRPDIIRFVCTCIIPTNEILQSDVLQRWTFCGWLLSTCSDTKSTSTTRLALVWDWLLFNENRNNIMDIEPCLLLMHHSRKSHPQTTYGILDFLLRLIKEFHAPLEAEIQRGVINSFRYILKIGVVRSLNPILVDTQKQGMLTACLKNLIAAHLTEFLPAEMRKVEPPAQAPPAAVRKEGRKQSESGTDSEISGDGSRFSDEEESVEQPTTKKEPVVVKTPKIEPKEGAPASESSELTNRYLEILESINRANRTGVVDGDLEAEILKVREIDEEIADRIEKLQKVREDDEEFAHELDNLATEIGQFDNGTFDADIAKPVATCISRLCEKSFENATLPPPKPTPEDFEGIIGRPLYILFRHLCRGNDSDQEQGQYMTNLTNLVVALQHVDERTVHHLMYYIQLQDLQDFDQKWFIYDFFCYTYCQRESAESIEIQLSINIQSLQEHDPDLLVYLIPNLFREYGRYTTDNKEIIKLIISVISPTGLMHLQSRLYNGEFQMFSSESPNDLRNLLIFTLDWESFEQTAVWRLLFSHENIGESWAGVLPALDSGKHPEAITAIQAHIRSGPPTQHVLKMLMARDVDEFVVSTLYHWAKSDKMNKDLVDCLSNVIHRSKSKAPRQSSRRGQSNRGDAAAAGPTFSQIMAHLDALRLYGEVGSFGFYKSSNLEHLETIKENRMKIFNSDATMAFLMYLKSNCEAADKEKYQDLLNCFSDPDSSEDEQPLSQKKKRRDKFAGERKAKSKKRSQPEDKIVTIDDDSDDEPAKKTKRI